LGGAGLGGEQHGGGDGAERGDAGGDQAPGGEPVEEGGGGCGLQLGGGGAEPGVGNLLGGDERAADRLFGGLGGLGGEPGGEGESGGVEGGEDAADDGDAEGAADLAGGVVHGGADAGLLFGDDAHDRLGGRCGGETQAAAEEDQLAGELEVGGRHRRGGDPEEPEDGEPKSGRDDGLVAHLHGESGADDGRDGHGGGDGQEADAGLEGAVGLQELEVLGDDERETEQGEERDRHGSAGGGEAKVAEQRDVEHGRFGSSFPADEQGEEHRGGAEAGEAAAGGPAHLGRFDDGEHECGDRGGRQAQAGEVEAGRPGGPRGRHLPGPERRGEGGPPGGAR